MGRSLLSLLYVMLSFIFCSSRHVILSNFSLIFRLSVAFLLFIIVIVVGTGLNNLLTTWLVLLQTVVENLPIACLSISCRQNLINNVSPFITFVVKLLVVSSCRDLCSQYDLSNHNNGVSNHSKELTALAMKLISDHHVYKAMIMSWVNLNLCQKFVLF